MGWTRFVWLGGEGDVDGRRLHARDDVGLRHAFLNGEVFEILLGMEQSDLIFSNSTTLLFSAGLVS